MRENYIVTIDKKAPIAHQMIEEPVFLVGAERSGSTMLSLMLNDHPEVCWLSEFGYSVDKLGEDGGWPDLDSYRRWLSCHRQFTGTGFVIDEDLNYPQLVNSFLLQKQQRQGTPFVGATLHRHFDRLLTIWTDAKFVHILRDPRDVARSTFRTGWEGHIYYGADRWLHAERTWERIIQNISTDRYVELRYERLLEDPESELYPVWKLIGADPSEYVMKYFESSSYDRPKPNNAYQWKTKLGRYELQLIENRLGSMIAEKGYEPSANPPIRISKLARLGIDFQNRWGRMMSRRRQYGTLMWLASIIASRLPFEALFRIVRLKLNEIERRQLK